MWNLVPWETNDDSRNVCWTIFVAENFKNENSLAIPSTDCHRIPTEIQGDVPVVQVFKLVFPSQQSTFSFITPFNEEVRLSQAWLTGK
jgi:hypothetical protein